MKISNISEKQGLTAEQLTMIQSEVSRKEKSKGVTYALWFFTGVFGGHRFYLGDTGYAIALLLVGWATFGIWPLIDVFFIGKRLEDITKKIELDAIEQVKANTVVS